MAEEFEPRVKLERPKEIKQITPYIWEIPKTHKPGMNVPARIVASKALLDQMDPGVFDQVTNVATLPGLQKFAYCMPDGHWGYGFPIGGVAAFDLETGVISPGGIGFDINCLPGEARVSLDNGTWTTIEELDNKWAGKKLVLFDKDNLTVKLATPAAFMKREENEELYEITTESGRILKVTKDHPVLTGRGFVEAENLDEQDTVFIRTFSGMKYEPPTKELIVSLSDIENSSHKIGLSEKGNRKIQVINFLKKLKLDEIRYDSPQLPAILKLMGFVFGDGSIYFNKADGRGFTAFYGKGEDLEDIRRDLQNIGLKAQKVYSRERHHKINTFYGLSEFDFTEESLLKRSTALALLLVSLGTPHGNKTAQEYRVPKWIMKAPLWQKRLFLASFFGAELSKPKTINSYDFYAPQLNMNKLENLKGNAEEFLNDIRLLLSEFGITSAYPVAVDGNQYKGKNGKTVGLRLTIHSNSENLIKLYELVGFEYNREKTNVAALASNYIRVKEMALLKRKEARQVALRMYNSGKSPSEIRNILRSKYVSDHFINHSIWPDRSDNTRVPPTFPSFKEYEKNLVGDGVVLDKIAQIQAVQFKGIVYDLTMNDRSHTFIADNFVTHNCGMRLVLTNLTFKDVQPHLRTLVNKLYDKVPAGVGSSGFVKLTAQQFKEVVELGGEWCVKNGYGWEEDLERTEENGRMKGADVSKVSDKAIQRGKDQIGTLGSGNHYLEIQRVLPENIIDPVIAKKWGIFPDQIVIMFHCLPGDAKVLTEYGYTIPMQKLEGKWENTNVKCMSVKEHNVEDTKIIKFFKLKPCGKIYKIRTKTGKELIATEEHPILAKEGLKLMKDIQENDSVAVMPFDGIEYEEPSDEIIVSEEDVRKIENNDVIIKNLKERGLLPLKFNSEKLPILTKLLGFATGDGWLGKSKDRWSLKFIGKPEDLGLIRKDIDKIGYKTTQAYSQKCESEIEYTDGKKRKISGTTNTIVVGSLGLPILLYALGTPYGNKSKTKFEVPKWIFKAPKWIKRLYLASYFGAELTRPTIRKVEKYRFGLARLSVNKLISLKDNGTNFLDQIKALLNEFGIEVTKLYELKGVKTKSGEETVKLRIDISSKEENLKKLWSKVGFEYCQDRINLSSYALQYLNLKQKMLEKESLETNETPEKLSVTSFKFRSVDYPTFDQFREEYKLNPTTPVIWDIVIGKEEIKNFDGCVYDFTVAHQDHTFIANGFITGNCGSRGYGHQVATDYLTKFLSVMEAKYKIKILDRELACAPFNSPEGQDYFKAMQTGINMSFANRQVILHRIREVFSDVFKQSPEKLGMHQLYDVAHNTAKVEEYTVDGVKKKLIVHRKGATRSLGPGREEIPKVYREDGQPVIIGGSMETGSYLLVGTKKAEEETFGSTCHGSGRTMSRMAAKRMFRGDQLQKDMEKRGILVKSVSFSGLAEEAGGAYKSVDMVVESAEKAGISNRVVKLIPIGNVKG